MKRNGWLALVALLALLLAGTVQATVIAPLNPNRPQAEWEQVAEGVFQRITPVGTTEVLGFGNEALAWHLAQVEAGIVRLQGLVAEGEGGSDLILALADLEALAAELRADVASSEGGLGPFAKPLGGLDTATVGCNLSVTRNASAFPTSSGPKASASASFSDTCSTYGEVRSYAYADGIYAGARRISVEYDPASGFRGGYGGASSSASASVVATSDCYSYAYAHVRVLDSFGQWANFTRSATNYTCRLIIEDPIDPCYGFSAEGVDMLPKCPIPY